MQYDTRRRPPPPRRFSCCWTGAGGGAAGPHSCFLEVAVTILFLDEDHSVMSTIVIVTFICENIQCCGTILRADLLEL